MDDPWTTRLVRAVLRCYPARWRRRPGDEAAELAEPYLPRQDPLGLPIASRQHPYRVPFGQFYVLGDNRAISCDSRYWGPITGSSIIGQVVLVWWHDGHPDLHWL